MASRTNPTCAQCQQAYSALNGRFCKRLGTYVEYAKEPPCKTANKK